jgi:hypothetical protein
MPRLVSGATACSGLSKVTPSCQARGRASSTSLTAAASEFDYFTGWTTTDFNHGALLNSGGYCEIPSGFGGKYFMTFQTNSTTTTNYNTAWIYHYDGSTYTQIQRDYAYNDYSNYTVGGPYIFHFDAGDRLYFGFDDRYGVPSGSDHYSRMSMRFLEN